MATTRSQAARGVTPLRARQQAATAEAMLDAAERELVKRGWERATMQDIAAQTGCAVGTFYLYFKNKHVLFEAILLRHMKAMNAMFREAMDRADGPLEKVREVVLAAVRYWQERPGVLRVAFAAWPMRHRAFEERMKELGWQDHVAIRRELNGHLREAQKRGLVRRDVGADILMDFIEGMLFSMMETFSFSPRKGTAEDQLSMLWGLLAGGLLHGERS